MGDPKRPDPPKEPGPEAPKPTGAEETEQWIYTVKKQTGELVKVEQVDPQSGERKEVPLEQLFPTPQPQIDPWTWQMYTQDPWAAYYGSPYMSAYDPYNAWSFAY